MEVVEKLGVAEPQWILDRSGESGPLVWRRQNSESNQRVKFRYDVEVKEFHRSPHELVEPDWTKIELQEYSFFAMGMTCVFCITLTMILPFYVLAGTQ